MSIFLNNSGDIILDAVLTDEGRRRLAKGDGTFKIVKFALGDDEINYKNYDLTASSALKDQDIMSTPVLEAFTNNAASLKNKLITIADKNLLFLPVLKLNQIAGVGRIVASQGNFSGGYIIPVETSQTSTTTYNNLTSSNQPINGVLRSTVDFIAVDQGIDSSTLSKLVSMKDAASGFSSLYETEYNIIIDSRLGIVQAKNSGVELQGKSIDDDGMAIYSVREGNTEFVNAISVAAGQELNNVILGNQGSRLQFNIVPTAAAISTNNLFNSLGFSVTLNSQPFTAIRTSVKVVGRTTGYTLDIPVIFVKKA